MKAPFARALVVALLSVMAVSGSVAANGPTSPSRDALLRELGRSRTVVDRDTGNVSFVGGTRANPAATRTRLGAGAGPQAVARAFIARYGALFGAHGASALRIARTVTSEAATSVRFQQVQDGVPVISGEILVQVDRNGNVISATGEATDSSAESTTPHVSAAQAAAAARFAVSRDSGVAKGALDATPPALAIYDHALLGAGGRAGARLVWRTEVTNADRTVDEYVLVDAVSGGIALRFSQVEHAKSRWVCTAAPGRKQVGNANVPCASPGWTESSPPPTSWATGNTEQREVRGAFTFSGNVYDFFKARFDRDSYDGAGGRLISTVRYCGYACSNYNAYWDGYQAVFWPGMATDDVVAHEFVHGFTEHTSNLLYYHQSGAINEALSDVFGELIDLTNGSTDDTAGNRWLMGEGSVLGAIRDMADPTLGNDPVNGQPDHLQSPLWWADEGDNYGVHVNSGVANKAAFLMVDGGSFNGETISAIGIDKTAAIWYRVATQYLWSGSDYADLGAGLNQACSDLWDAATPIHDATGVPTGNPIVEADCLQVANVVEATRMASTPTVPGSVASPAPECVGGSYALSFMDDFDGGLGSWTASNSRFTTSEMYTESGTPTLHGLTFEMAGSGAATRSLGTLPAGVPTFVTFRHAYILDHFYAIGYDGGAVEYSVDGGAWTDAATLFTHNGYNGSIHSYLGGGNPLAGRSAFVGWSPGFLTSRLDLTNLTGHAVQLRFVAGSDADIGDYGWFIDDFKLFTCAGAADIGGPVVSPPDIDFRTGVSVGGTNPIKLSVSFDASDVSGVSSTALQQRTGQGSWSVVPMGSATATSVDLDYVTHTRRTRQLRTSATDGHGNLSPWALAPAFKVLAFQNGGIGVVQQGTGWKTQSSSSFYGGSVRHNKNAGARQQLMRTMSEVAIVTTLGPNRGKFDVYIDGGYKATIDTYAATTSYKRVVFAWDFGSAGTHTVELRVLGAKNAASTGTRVDFDAFLVLAP